MIGAFLLAGAAACANAVSNVLQRKADRDEPAEVHLSPRLILDLLRRKVWLGGIGAVIAAFVLQAAALDMGALGAVQPIVILELPLTLIGAAVVFGTRLGKREWGATVAMSAGLAGLIGFALPHGGSGRIGWIGWVVGGAVTAGPVAVLTVVAERYPSGGRRPALLGAATGITFGLTAAFMKGMTGELHGSLWNVFTAWQLYAMVAAGLCAMFLLQNALQAGRLVAAQPGITLLDPLTAMLWGIVVFHEDVRGGMWLGLALACASVMAGAAVVLATSPLLEGASAGREESGSQAEGDVAAAGTGRPAAS